MADKTTGRLIKAEVHHTRTKADAEVTAADDSSGGDLSPGRDLPDPSQKNCRTRGIGHTVSRPPSSHLTPVDEEDPQTGPDGRRSRAKSVETVDRGVGPTPLPQPPPPGSSSLPETRLPSYLSFQPFGDPRNGLLEAYAAAGSLPYPYVPYGCPVNAPLPLNPSTLEGRYNWPPVSFQPSLHGLPASPTPSDVSLLSMRSPMLPREPVTQLASRIHWEQLQRNYCSPLSSRRISSSGLPFPGASPFIGEYPAPPSLSGRSLFSDVPPTPGSGSITLPGSLESSRLNSPRASIIGGKSRKRTLSHSPISDYLDIQSLTRSSEGSLQLASFLQHNSRSSSAASGSYGHLSAASVGTASPAHPLLPSNPYYRQNPMPPPNFIYAPHLHPMLARQGHPGSLQGQMLPPGLQGSLAAMGHKGDGHLTSNREHPLLHGSNHISTTTKEAGSSSIVSSTMDGASEIRKAKVKKEHENVHRTTHPDEEEEMFSERGDHIPHEGEPDFLETNCHWVDCHKEFDTQDDLVKHLNQDHIQSNKKSFVCRWTDCSREEKPFKAQYMLVVHMRRHTGEKPHRCTFEGCNKAYSRLENLKTHLRSHTGEKPYMCEFPGCTKAFSNASDRAKHQNRTHSNAKPYVCKAVGCTKRYTDPSSLRKHVKTVHGPDFYANKKHKGDTVCHVKKEDPDGDHDSCDVNHQMEDKMGVTSYSGPPSGDNRHSQDNIGSAPSSNSQMSPESSPEVIVTCGLDQGQLIDDRVSVQGGGGISEIGMDEEEVIVPEPNEAEIIGSGALLTRRHAFSTGQLIHNRLKDRMNNKGGLLSSPLPQLPSIHSPVPQPGIRDSNIGEPCHVSITEISPKNPLSNGSPQHKRITDLAGKESNSWRDNSTTLLPTSRRESNTSSLSSYMSSMRSDTFSSRRSSGISQFSSRRSSGASRWSIANSPYEYDISGNLPNPVSRRSSGESSTNIGNVSAMMQKANLGSHSGMVAHPPSAMLNGSAMPSCVMNNASMGPCGAAGAASAAGGSGCGSGCAAANGSASGSGAGGSGSGSGNGSGNRYYNERLARYFSARKDSEGGVRTSTPCMTPLPHEIPNREIRRASDPVKSKDSNQQLEMGKSLQRCHSLNMVKPLPTPASMKSLKSKSGSVNTFKSSHSSIATDVSLPEQGEDNKDRDCAMTDAELEEKMLEDTEDVIIPDDMRRFLDETAKHHDDGFEDGADGILDSLLESPEVNQDDPRLGAGSSSVMDAGLNSPSNNNNAINTGNLAVVNSNMANPHILLNRDGCPYPRPQQPLQTSNLQVQTGFADLHGGAGGVMAGVSPLQPMDAFQASPQQRHNFSGNNFVVSGNTWSGEMVHSPLQQQECKPETRKGSNSSLCSNNTPDRRYSGHSNDTPDRRYSGHSNDTPDRRYSGHSNDTPDRRYSGHSNDTPDRRYSGHSNDTPDRRYSGHSNDTPDRRYSGHSNDTPDRRYSGHSNDTPDRRYSGHSAIGDDTAPPCVKMENCNACVHNKRSCSHADMTSPNHMVKPDMTESTIGVKSPCSVEPPSQCQGHSQDGRMAMTGHHMTGYGPSIRPPCPLPNHPHLSPNNNTAMPLCGASLGQRFPPPSPNLWGTSGGSGAYLSQHNLMQHQLQQQIQQQHQHHLQQQQELQQQQMPQHGGAGGGVSRPMSTASSSAQVPYYPNPYHMAGPGSGPSPMPPHGGFSPMPPPGEKPTGLSRPHHHKQCTSPQVQVPHISQSQIPPNAKTANRGGHQILGKQQQQQHPNQSSPHSHRPPPHPHSSLMSPTGPHCQNNRLYSMTPCGPMPHSPHQSQHPTYPPQTAYPPTQPYPPPPHNMVPCHPHHQVLPPQSPQVYNPNHISHPESYNSLQPPYLNHHPHHPAHTPPCHPQQQSINPSPFPQQNDSSYHPMEMSPGCNQVTSSTDCKETTAPPIEDFMENLTSISTENLMENITSISQDNIVYSPTPASMRTASQNSGRFNTLMNTSNMVVNDMSSVLTQLAEENKYLNMRP